MIAIPTRNPASRSHAQRPAAELDRPAGPDVDRPEPQRVRHDADRGQRHRGGGEGRAQQDPEGRVEHAHRDRDQHDVVGERPEQVLADDPERGARQRDRRRDQPRVAADQRDVRGLDGHVRAGPDGHAEVGAGQRRGVVDAVADHRDPPPLALEPRHQRLLVGGQRLGHDAVGRDADLAPDRLGGGPRVAGEQPHLEAGVAQLADRLGRLGLDRIGDGEEPGDPPVDRDPRRGPAVGGDGLGLAGERVDGDAALLEQPPAPDQHGRPVDRPGHAAPDDRLEALDPPEPQLVLAGAPHDGLAQRVLGARLERRGEVQDPRRLDAGSGHDAGHHRPAQRERPGLVHDDGVDPARGLERLAAADEDPRLRAAPGPDHDRGRRREAHGARAGDDHDPDERRQRERDPRLRAPQEPGRRTSPRRRPAPPGTNTSAIRSARRWIGALEPWARWTSSTIRARAVSRPTWVARITNDPVVLSVAPMTSSPTRFVAGIGSPVSIDSSTAEAPSTTTPSTGTLSPGPHAQQVAREDVGERHVRLLAVADPPGGRRLEADQPPDRAGRPALGPGLQPSAEQDQADDDRRGVEVGLGVQAGVVDDLGPHRDEHGVAPGGGRADGDQRVHRRAPVARRPARPTGRTGRRPRTG